MGPGRAGEELRVELYADEPRMVHALHDLDQSLVRRGTGDDEPVIGKRRAVVIVDLVAVAGSLHHEAGTVGLLRLRPRHEVAGPVAEAHRAAHIHDSALI